MTNAELQALLPQPKQVALDYVYYRDLINHWSMFGSYSIIKKLGKGRWIVEFRGHGNPLVFKTREAAANAGGDWVCAISAAKMHLKAVA